MGAEELQEALWRVPAAGFNVFKSSTLEISYCGCGDLETHFTPLVELVDLRTAGEGTKFTPRSLRHSAAQWARRCGARELDVRNVGRCTLVLDANSGLVHGTRCSDA